MKKLLIFLVLIILVKASYAQTSFSISVRDDEAGFAFSISNFYRVPEREVIVIRERGIPEEELPVVFFIAKKAKVKPATIIDLRLRGMSWMDISLKFGLTADVFYVPVKVVEVGPPFGKAYGHYKKYPKHKWKEIRLDDDDIVNLVNVKFMSEYHGVEPEIIISEKSHGKRYIVLDKEFKEKKHKKHKKDKEDKKEKKEKKHKKHEDD
ncbi:MAG: hypothetical protein N2202_08605 [Proteobacteria bacterium]|nr:hypothetical protein [Pseudomonadota bacterium]